MICWRLEVRGSFQSSVNQYSNNWTLKDSTSLAISYKSVSFLYVCEFENLAHLKCERWVNDLIAAIPANAPVLFSFYFYVRPFMIRGNAAILQVIQHAYNAPGNSSVICSMIGTTNHHTSRKSER